MKQKVLTGVRILLGLMLVVFGANKVLGFIPQPPMAEAAGAFMGGLAAGKFFFPLLALTEVGVGLMLLLNKFVPLALIILAPVALNMVLFHLTLDPAGGIPAYFVFVAGLALAKSHCEVFKPLLKA